MNISTLLAQTSYYTQSYDSSQLTDEDIAVAIAFYAVVLVAAVISYILMAICLMSIFKKAGVPTWAAWVPFYNQWKLLEIGGQQGYWSVLSLVPIVSIVSIVYIIIAQYHVGKKLGKDGAFVLLAIFLPYVWYIWLAADKSTWNDEASSAPSLHTPTSSKA